MQQIRLRGVRTHNLKNFDLDLPRDKLIVITGLSGSGKSSLAFDTIYAEGQRRYVESLSAYARQFLSVMEKPDIDTIEGLSPAISIEQKTTSHNPRSTVGTITEIYDYLRLLYARAGIPQCPTHHSSLAAQTISQMVDKVIQQPDGKKLMLLAPVVSGRKGEHQTLLTELNAQGFIRARVDGDIVELDSPPKLEPHKKHDIDVIVDRFRIKEGIETRLAESFETALNLTDSIVKVASMDDPNDELIFSSRFACPHCGYSIQELEPRLFSFNNPVGACPTCDGLGVEQKFDPEKIISNSELSIAAGAIRGWDRRNSYYFQLLRSLSEHYEFDIETPWQELSDAIHDVILYGSKGETITFNYFSDRGKSSVKKHPFEGIINNMKRRYHETESNAVREELSRYISKQPCSSCDGNRLNEGARNVMIDDKPIHYITSSSIIDNQSFFKHLRLPGTQGEIAKKIIREISLRLDFLVNVGLDYLTLDRSADTLSGGEAQRIRLASQIGAGLVGVMYVLDEPSIGLHQRDNDRLLKTLNYLRDLGNTVIVVEHDEDAIRSADYIVDIGPGAGVHGGEIIAIGTAEDISKQKESLTGDYLSGRRKIEIPAKLHQPNSDTSLIIHGCTGNNLKNVTLDVPARQFTCVTGVSGSGKSTLINDTLYPIAANALNKANQKCAPHTKVEGLEHFDKVVDIDQSPIGRTPRSNPATYTGLFTPIRELFAGTHESRSRGYTPGRFSFNVKGGRCEACSGDGVVKVEMHFLADVYVQCDVCNGKRYNRETLEVRYKGLTINQVLDLTVEDALPFFDAVPTIQRKLQTLIDVGLSYLTLGQNATTLSGGEAQRVKLARELSKRDTGNTLYILDEPTTGLHFHDVKQLLHVLHQLRDQGNTVVVIEHNLDVVKTADWVIDLGPEGGDGGGKITASTTPEALCKITDSHTGRYLAKLFEK